MIKRNASFLFLFVGIAIPAFAQTNPITLTTTTITAALPEVLLTFDANINDNRVELSWYSTNEQNNNRFIIEKSKDAMVFEEVTTVKNFGNNSTIINYFDVDYLPFEGVSYYRLKQITPQGITLSSRIVSVNYRGSHNSITSTSPIADEPIILMGSENKEELVVLRNEKGEETFSKVVLDKNNEVVISSTIEIKPNKGTYTIVASSNNKLYSKKVVVNTK